MRRLFVILPLVGIVAAFFAIVPRQDEADDARFGIFGRIRNVSVAYQRLWALGDTVRAMTTALQRTQAWELARALPNDPALAKVIALPGVPTETLRAFEAAAADEFAAIPSPRVPLRVVLQNSDEASGFSRKSVVLPQEAGQPCVIVVHLPKTRGAVRPNSSDRLLGTCAFYARFGPAGTGMQEWIESTRGVAASVDTVLGPTRREPELREPKGADIGLYPAQTSCLAGRDADCASAILDPYGFRQTRFIVPVNERTRAVVTAPTMTSAFGPGQTLAALREQVGDARFAQIWASAQSPTDAFEAVTGEHIAVFARPILLRQSLPHEPGPLRGGFGLLFSLSIGAIASLWAITRTRRERS